ncbi:hypothetical protein CPB86DRAFT_778041 [Serendipita vermifera]|nr:hypothetical protein CPB86DRAFT_778041 [Serendipita vermifera]
MQSTQRKGRRDQKRFDHEQRRETVGYAIKKDERKEEEFRLRKMPRVRGMEDLELKMCALHETIRVMKSDSQEKNVRRKYRFCWFIAYTAGLL